MDESLKWFVFLLVFGPCFVLQTIGLFSPNWVIKDSCDAVGLFYRCCTQNSSGCFVDGKDTYLSEEVLGLQAASFSFMFLAVISMCCVMQCGKGDDPGCTGATLMCSIVLYPVAGLFSIVGCIVLAANYSTSQLSWGFFLCVAAGCYILLLTITVCGILIKLVRSRKESDEDCKELEYEVVDKTYAHNKRGKKIDILRSLYDNYTQ